MFVGSQDLEGVLAFNVAPTHAGYGERVAYERVHKEVWMGSCQCRKRSRVIVQLVANRAANPSPTIAMREQQDVPAAEVVQTQDLLGDRGWNSLTLARFPDLSPNRVAPEFIAGEWLDNGLGAVC